MQIFAVRLLSTWLVCEHTRWLRTVWQSARWRAKESLWKIIQMRSPRIWRRFWKVYKKFIDGRGKKNKTWRRTIKANTNRPESSKCTLYITKIWINYEISIKVILYNILAIENATPRERRKDKHFERTNQCHHQRGRRTWWTWRNRGSPSYFGVLWKV